MSIPNTSVAPGGGLHSSVCELVERLATAPTASDGVFGDGQATPRRSTREFVLQVRGALGTLPTSVLIMSDPFPYYQQALEQTFGPVGFYVQV